MIQAPLNTLTQQSARTDNRGKVEVSTAWTYQNIYES